MIYKDFEYRAFTYLADSVCSLWRLPVEHLESLMKMEPRLGLPIYTGTYNSVQKRYQNILNLRISKKLSLEDVIEYLKGKVEQSQSQQRTYQRQSSTWGQLVQSTTSLSLQAMEVETENSIPQASSQNHLKQLSVSQFGENSIQEQN
eukprot:TRINITY_DN867_c0_g1_i8.p3 TRINITY_DN867_c0_g1~~TRINITY_DN867_c0_g1_i8.p3  ORF type:complete len:147 (-),score=23.93 TRINITY_DN867_c0_g1_i8:986-1426(-)